MNERSVGLEGSVFFLLPWMILYLACRKYRKTMVWGSLLVLPVALAEPIFVPAYRTPSTVFGPVPTAGFNLESLIFLFGLGGTAAVLYNLLTGTAPETRSHAWPITLTPDHYVSLAVPIVLFTMLYFVSWNPVYPGSVALLYGAVVILFSQPNRETAWFGGVLFMVYDVVFLRGLDWISPGHLEHRWNLNDLMGIRILALPLEEYLFAFALGTYWAGLYELITRAHEETALALDQPEKLD